jgi:hypothetical protein
MAIINGQQAVDIAKLIEQPELDVWFGDASGFEGDPRPRKRWDKKERKTRATKNGGHLRMNAIGFESYRKNLAYDESTLVQ